VLLQQATRISFPLFQSLYQIAKQGLSRHRATLQKYLLQKKRSVSLDCTHQRNGDVPAIPCRTLRAEVLCVLPRLCSELCAHFVGALTLLEALLIPPVRTIAGACGAASHAGETAVLSQAVVALWMQTKANIPHIKLASGTIMSAWST